MLNLYFLLGEKRPSYLSNGEQLLTNITSRLSLDKFDYEIDYCYFFTPPSTKKDRELYKTRRLEELVKDFEFVPDRVIIAFGWMATEVLTNIGKTRASNLVGCRFPIQPFKYDVWFTYDPAGALFDPNLYVDLMAHVSAAIRYSGRTIKINKTIKPYEWSI